MLASECLELWSTVQIDNESVSESDKPGGLLGPLSKPDVILPSSAIILLFIA
jgi:hypothetical protein